MQKIDMHRIRETLPKNGKAVLGKKDSVCFIYCTIERPSLCEVHPETWENDYQMIKDWQRQIVGEALSEFYTLTEGSRWYIYLKRVPMEFINTTDEDIKSYSGFTAEQLKNKK